MRVCRRYRLWILGAVISLPLLSGCAAAELEDRSFPTEIAVENVTEFGREWPSQEQSGSRITDYSHLKVIILSEDFLKNAEEMNEFLDLLEEKADVPRNTYVLASENPGAVLGQKTEGEQETQSANPMEEAEPGGGAGETVAVGTYLEQYMENASEIDKRAYPTLGMLYQEQENRTETLFIPAVELKGGLPVITGYYAWVRGSYSGAVDSGVAMLSAFIAGETTDYTLQLQEDHYIRLSDVHSTYSTEGNTIRVVIRCDGELIYGDTLTKRELAAAAEHYITETAQSAAKQRGIDVSNSYKKLGGLDRELYFRYQRTPWCYEQEMDFVYELKVTWVNQ